jgi:hypothetical protein
MSFELLTNLSPEEVLERAASFYRERSRLQEAERTDGAITFRGRAGTARIEADRHYSHTVVRAETDRGVGLDVTDLTLRFLYTLPHV